MLTVNRAIVLGLGEIGYRVLQAFDKQLNNRHPEQYPLPCIKMLALLEREPDHVTNISFPYLTIEQHEHQVHEILEHLYPQPEPLTGNHPLYSNLLIRPRLQGQISLRQYADKIRRHLQQSYQETQYEMDHLEEKSISIQNPNETQVFLIFSLADGFMSGLLPDLPYLIRNALQSRTSAEHVIHIHPLVALPGFEGDIKYQSDIQSWVDARAAACLQEMDYYFNDVHRYSEQMSDRIRIDTSDNPLGEGKIYILDSVNEADSRRSDLNSLTSMVGMWLYQTSCTELSILLNTSQPTIGTTYASFGVSNLHVPLKLWIHQATIRLELELITKLLLQPSSSHSSSVLAPKIEQLRLGRRFILDDLMQGTSHIALRIRSVNQHSEEKLLGAIQRQYHLQLTEQLPLLRDAIHKQRRQKSANLREKIESTCLEILGEPGGGLIKTQRFIDRLHEDVTSQVERLKQEIKALQDQIVKRGEEIEQLRTRFVSVAQVSDGFLGVPYLKMILGLVAGALPLLLLINEYYNQINGVSIFVSVLFVFILCFGVVLLMARNIHAERINLLSHYNGRLTDLLEIEKLKALQEIYHTIGGLTRQLKQNVRAMVEQLSRIQVELLAAQRSLDIAELCAFANGRLSESLLRPEFVKNSEREAFSSHFVKEQEEIRQVLGNPATWIPTSSDKDRSNEDSAAAALKEFVQKHAEAHLKQYDIVKLAHIGRVSSEELKKSISRISRLSQPYWRFDSSMSSYYSSDFQQIVAAHPKIYDRWKQHIPSSISVAESNEDESSFQAIQSEYEFVIISQRQGVRLSESSWYTELNRSYEYHKQDLRHSSLNTIEDPLHTASDRHILKSNPQWTRATSKNSLLESLPSRHLTAIGFLLEKVIQERDSGNFSYVNQMGNKESFSCLTLVEVAEQIEVNPDVRYKLIQSIRDDISIDQLNRGISAEVQKTFAGFQDWIVPAVEDFIPVWKNLEVSNYVKRIPIGEPS
ncbi:MAG: tubulin-like doman-containing protein [Chloroflexota bacterium]